MLLDFHNQRRISILIRHGLCKSLAEPLKLPLKTLEAPGIPHLSRRVMTGASLLQTKSSSVLECLKIEDLLQDGSQDVELAIRVAAVLEAAVIAILVAATETLTEVITILVRINIRVAVVRAPVGGRVLVIKASSRSTV